MKTSHFFYFLLAIILFSCGNSQSENQNDEYAYTENFSNTNDNYQNNNTPQQTNVSYQQNKQQQNTSRNQTTGGGKKKFLLKDPSSGMVMGTMPIPQSWNPTPNNKETYIEGPQGLKVYQDQTNFFYYSNDAGFNNFMKQNGNLVKQTMGMEEFFNKEFKPLVEKMGNRLVNKFPLKQMADLDSRIDMMFFKATPENTMFEAMVTEWVDKDGLKSVIIVKHRISNYGQGKQGWGYTYSGMEVGNANYEQAKNDFINALLNVQVNPQYVQASNQKAQQQTQQFNAGHQQRMAQIKSFGENNTRNFNARSAANDARHNSWRAGQASSDAGHSNFINSINETSTMTDNNGNYYQVEGYSNNTWVNGGNEAIQTDDYNYNPNSDLNTNGTDWQQLQNTDDGSDW